jgi:hypothetical protein
MFILHFLKQTVKKTGLSEIQREEILATLFICLGTILECNKMTIVSLRERYNTLSEEIHLFHFIHSVIT